MTEFMDRRVKPPWWTSARVRLGAGVGGAALLVALIAAAFGGPMQRSVRVPSKGLTIETVRQDVFHDFTPLQGKVAPRDILYLDALQGGQVEAVFVQAGDQVIAGQPLIRFSNPDVELDVLNREAVLSQSITQAQGLQNQLEAARAANEKVLQQIDYDIVRLTRAAERRDELARKGLFPQEQLDQLHDELAHYRRIRPVQVETNRRQEELRAAQLPKIQTTLANLQRSLGENRARLDDLTVRAPVSGRLTVIDLKIGQNQRPGDRLAELVPDTGYKVTADIDEFYIGRIQTGQTAEAELDGVIRRLRVARIYPQVKDGLFKVDLEFAGPLPGRLNPGEAVQGKLVLGDDRPAAILSAGPFLERSGGDWVFVVDPGGRRAERRRIRIGRRNSEQVEVLSGLRPGDRVVTSDYAGFEQIDRINIAN